jgi:hypothetical protein
MALVIPLFQEILLTVVMRILAHTGLPLKEPGNEKCRHGPNDDGTGKDNNELARRSTVSYMTIPIASLKMASPKMIAYRFTSASISLKTASTETGSVALIRLPKAKESLQENSGERSV